MPSTRIRLWIAVVATLGLALVGCTRGGGGGNQTADQATTATGPIKIWYSNNQDEVKWGKAVVAAWNQAHSDQQVTAQEIPAGKSSEEVIGASITAGNTPCLIFNTAPAAVPQFQKQGGLVALDSFSDGASYLSGRVGARADQYKSPDGKFYQMPWKTNPVQIFYNKKVFAKAGLNADKPPLATYQDFLATAKTLVDKGGVKAAIWPAPSSEFFQSWFDFYPLFIAETGKQLVVDGQPQFNSPEGVAVGEFWKQLYKDGLAQKEMYNGDAFGAQKTAMAIVGPWAIAVYGDKVDWGVAPLPTSSGKDPSQIQTFSDEKSIGMYSACKNRGTAWEFLKFATSQEQDGKLLDVTGQMPMRENLPSLYGDYFKAHPEYTTFAEQAARTVEVPNVPNSVEIWQTYRDAYTQSVIFGRGDVKQSFDQAADKVKTLAAGS
jgi:multiple sugar transport system substrate-binding protein